MKIHHLNRAYFAHKLYGVMINSRTPASGGISLALRGRGAIGATFGGGESTNKIGAPSVPQIFQGAPATPQMVLRT